MECGLKGQHAHSPGPPPTHTAFTTCKAQIYVLRNDHIVYRKHSTVYKYYPLYTVKYKMKTHATTNDCVSILCNPIKHKINPK